VLGEAAAAVIERQHAPLRPFAAASQSRGERAKIGAVAGKTRKANDRSPGVVDQTINPKVKF